jgi:hypothetical protein
MREQLELAVGLDAESPAIEAAVGAHDIAAAHPRGARAVMRQVQREVVSPILRANGSMQIGVVVAVIRMRIEQRVVAVGDAITVGIGNARELGLLPRDHDEALAVLHHHAEAVEKPLGKQPPFAVDQAPDAGIARADDHGAILGLRKPQRLEQLLPPEVVPGRVVVLDAVTRR